MRKGFTLIEMLVVFAILGVLISLLLPAIQSIRSAAKLADSKNRIKQISLGLHNLSTTNGGRLPGILDMNPRVFRHSLLVEILPYVEQGSVWEKFENGKNDPLFYLNNSAQIPVKLFQNPLDHSQNYENSKIPSLIGPKFPNISVSSYAMNGYFFRLYPNTHHISDGLSQTIWICEHYGWNCNNTTFLYSIDAASPWIPYQPAYFAMGSPRPLPGDYVPIVRGFPPVSDSEGSKSFQILPKIDECDPRLPNASSKAGMQIGLCDGSVKILGSNVSSTVFWSMVTHNQQEIFSTE